MRACEINVVRNRMHPPVPCGEPAEGYYLSEASLILTPACREHRNRTFWLEPVREGARA